MHLTRVHFVKWWGRPHSSPDLHRWFGEFVVALTGIGPYNNRFFHASVLSQNGRYGGIASLELWPLGGIGIGFVGARVKILPIEFALGVLGYDATPVGTWEAEDSDESDAD